MIKILCFIYELCIFLIIKIKLNSKKNLIFLPHGEKYYDELNGKTSLTKDIVLNLKKKNYYPFLLHKQKKNQYDIRLFERIFKYVPILKKNFNKNLSALRENLLKNKYKKNSIEKFLQTRSKLELIFFKNNNNSLLSFHHTAPLATGLSKWILFIENPITIFHPFLVQHKLKKKKNIKNFDFFKIIKNHILNTNCKKIFVNYHYTQKTIPEIFKDNQLKKKIVYFRQGTKNILNYNRNVFFKKKHKQLQNKNINFLFVNSFNHQDHNFYSRGGKFLLTAFNYIKKNYPNSTLTICSKIPSNLEPLVKKDKNINYIRHWISKKEWVGLFKNAHFLISPGIGGFTETNLHCMMNGTILISGNHFINTEKFKNRFICLKSLDMAINSINAKNFVPVPDYNFFFKNSTSKKIEIDIEKSVNAFIKQKKYYKYIKKNYQEYLTKFNFKYSIIDFNKHL